jgi:hypothetical protein
MSAFRQAYPKDRISVTFDTEYKSSGVISAPVFTLNESVRRVGKISVDKIIFPASYFVFNNGNNILGPDINGGVINITAGTYTATALAAAIQVLIRATGGGFSAATCVYSANRFTITSGSVSTFTINSVSSISPIMGFSSDKTTVTTATSDFDVYENNIVIVGHNKSFVINQTATDYTFNITPGNYTGNTLANEIQTQILLQLANFSVS